MVTSPSALPTFAPTMAPSSTPTVVPSLAPTPLPSMDCPDKSDVYKFQLYDAGGDGWGECIYSITNSSTTFDDHTVVMSGSLNTGSVYDEYFCMQNGCYRIEVTDDCQLPGEISLQVEDTEGERLECLEAPCSDAFCMYDGHETGTSAAAAARASSTSPRLTRTRPSSIRTRPLAWPAGSTPGVSSTSPP